MTGAAWNWVTTWETTLLAPGNHLSTAHGIRNINLNLHLSCNPHYFHLSYVRRKLSPGAQEKSRPEDSCSQGPQGPGPDLRVPATLPSGWPVSFTLAGCSCGGLQPAPPCPPHLSPPPQKLRPSITTGWARCRRRRRHDRPKKHPNFDLPNILHHHTHTPGHTRAAAATIIIISQSFTAALQSCRVDPVALPLVRLFISLSTGLERVVASAALRNKLKTTRPAHHHRERPTTLPIRERFFHGFW